MGKQEGNSVRQEISGSIKFLLVLKFARRSESGHRPVGPASLDIYTNIFKIDLLYIICNQLNTQTLSKI